MSAAKYHFSIVTLEQSRDEIRFCDSYSRLPAVLDLHPFMIYGDWLRLLGEEWSGFDNIGQHIDDLFDSPLFWRDDAKDAAVRREMMTADEQAAYDALPEVITIFRGCYKHNKWGLSWTLDKGVAERFPALNRYQQPGQQALLVTAQAKKSEVIAVKLDREEFEIITHRPKCISTRHINTAQIAA